MMHQSMEIKEHSYNDSNFATHSLLFDDSTLVSGSNSNITSNDSVQEIWVDILTAQHVLRDFHAELLLSHW